MCIRDRAEAVLLGDHADRAVDLGVADTHAHLPGACGLQAHQHQPLEHLALEDLARRQLVVAARILRKHVGNRAVEFALQDDVLVHDGGDALERHDVLRVDGGSSQQRGRQQGQEGLVHGRGSVSTGSPIRSDGGTR